MFLGARVAESLISNKKKKKKKKNLYKKIVEFLFTKRTSSVVDVTLALLVSKKC